MRVETRKKIAVGTFITAIIIECIALLLWLIPIAGFTIYPFVSGTAVIFSIICCIFAEKKRGLRIVSVIVCVLLVISIIADLMLLFGFMTEFLFFDL